MRTLRVTSRLWCPYAIPTGVELRFFYHRRSRNYSGELVVTLDWRPLPPAVPGSFVAWPGPPNAASWRPIASNSLQTPPSAGGHELDFQNWAPVEKPRAPGLTPPSVRALRSALFRNASHSVGLLGDWPMVRLLLTAAGALGFGGGFEPLDLGGDCSVDTDEMLGDGVLPAAKEGRRAVPEELCFLEHAARCATGAMRPVDFYAVPYDEAGAKREWAEGVLAARREVAEAHVDEAAAGRMDRSVRAASLWDDLEGRRVMLRRLPGGDAPEGISASFLEQMFGMIIKRD